MTALLIVIVTLALPLTLVVLGRRASPRPNEPSSARHSLRRAIVAHVLTFGLIYFAVLS